MFWFFGNKQFYHYYLAKLFSVISLLIKRTVHRLLSSFGGSCFFVRADVNPSNPLVLSGRAEKSIHWLQCCVLGISLCDCWNLRGFAVDKNRKCWLW